MERFEHIEHDWNRVKKHHYDEWCSAAWSTAKATGIDPNWIMQASTDFFELYSVIPNKSWKQVLRAMYMADVRHAQDLSIPVNYRGWMTLEDTIHPAITKELIRKILES